MPLGLPPVPALKQITTIIIQKVEKKSNEHRRFNRGSHCNIRTVHRHRSLASLVLAGAGFCVPCPVRLVVGLAGYVQEQSWMIDSTICLLLGIQKSERELPPGWDPTPDPVAITADVPIPVPTTEDPAEEEKQSPSAEPEKKSGRNKIDRGKVLALHRAGWSNKKIADEMACSEASVSMILKEEK